MAKKLVRKGKKWMAVDLLAQTLLLIYKTGVLLARCGDVFVYYERKTQKMHMLRIFNLAEIFNSIALTFCARSNMKSL